MNIRKLLVALLYCITINICAMQKQQMLDNTYLQKNIVSDVKQHLSNLQSAFTTMRMPLGKSTLWYTGKYVYHRTEKELAAIDRFKIVENKNIQELHANFDKYIEQLSPKDIGVILNPIDTLIAANKTIDDVVEYQNKTYSENLTETEAYNRLIQSVYFKLQS